MPKRGRKFTPPKARYKFPVVDVNPIVAKHALKACEGDVTRIRVEDANNVTIKNKGKERS